MKRWWTLDDLAAASLPGLPTTARGLLKLAERQGWRDRTGKVRPRSGPGGGYEYDESLLPVEARAELIRRSGAAQVINGPTEPLVFDGDRDSFLTRPEQELRDARLLVLERAHQFYDATRSGRRDLGRCDALFVAGVQSGAIELPAWVQPHIGGLSPRTLRRWRSIRDEQGADDLGLDGRRRGSSADMLLGGRVRAMAIALLARHEFISSADLRATLQRELGEHLLRQGGELPGERQIQRARAKWEEEMRNELIRLRDPDGYRNRIEFTAVGSTKADGLNDLWQIDASPADVMLLGKRRHSVYVAIDIWSRRLIVLVTQTPRAAAVALLIRKCLKAWGVPRRIKTDNGSDFTAHATRRLLDALGIAVEVSPPYQPKAKGTVERAIGTFQRALAGCPGFIGHSVADRKKIEGRKSFARRLGASDHDLFDVQMTAEEFQTWCDAWAETVYGHNIHGSLRMSPFARAASWAEPVRRVTHESALDVLLAPLASNGGIKTVTKSGIRIDNHAYYTSAAMPGAKVLVRMDPADLGRAIVFSADGTEWLGEALCPELAGLDPVETIQRVRAAQKAYEQERLADIRREQRKIGPRTVSDAVLARGAARAAALVPFPQRSTGHTTPALDAAAHAAGAATPARPAAMSPDEIEARRQALREAEALELRSQPIALEKPKDRFRRAIRMEDAEAAGLEIAPADAAWLRIYQQTPEYRAHRIALEDGGRAWLGA